MHLLVIIHGGKDSKNSGWAKQVMAMNFLVFGIGFNLVFRCVIIFLPPTVIVGIGVLLPYTLAVWHVAKEY